MSTFFHTKRPFVIRVTWLFLLVSLVSVWQGCKKSDDVEPQGQGLTNPDEVTQVVIIPGATVQQGTPPPVTRTGSEPMLSTTTPTVETISGLEATYSLDYSNVTGTIKEILIRFEGASSYIRVPIPNNTGRSGRINIPIRLPAEKYIQYPSGISFCTYALTANGACQEKCSNRFISNLPPRPGKATATVNGRSATATAVCDLDFAPFGRGYGIQIGERQFIILYNMRQGSNVLGNFEQLVSNSSSGVPTSPFALYFDGTNIYYTVYGQATVSGKTVSTFGHFEELTGSNRVTVSAAGNCQ